MIWQEPVCPKSRKFSILELFGKHSFVNVIIILSVMLILLSLTGDQYALLMKFIDHVYDNQVIDDLTVKIILPEGAK